MPTLISGAAWSGAPGLPVISASYTCSHGVTPGVATLVVPQVAKTVIGRYGTLSFSDGVRAPVNVRGCRLVDVAETDLPGGARGLVLTILDARHRWKYGAVSGAFNVIDRHPDPDTVPEGPFVVRGGIYVPGTERTPEQLIRTCFALLSQAVAFSGIPRDVRVPCDWKADNPARAADRVAEAVGCRLVYQPLADRVVVTPPGGFTRVDRRFPVLSEQPAYDTGDRPTAIQVVGGDTLVTDVVKLRAVGWEEDGRLRPIEELSYRPEGGWWNFSPDYEGWWAHIRRGDSTSVHVSRALAREFVWKLFRVEAVPVDRLDQGRKRRAAGGFKNPVWGKVRNRKAITLSDRQVFPGKDAAGQYKTRPARAFYNGVAWKKDRAGRLRNFQFPSDPAVPFAVDPDAGLVTFSRPMYRIREKIAGGADSERELDDQLYGPPLTNGRIQYTLADVFLKCAVRVRNGLTWQYHAGRWAAKLGADPGGELVETHARPELQEVYHVRRGADGFRRVDQETNAAEVARLARAVLAAAALKHQVADRLTRTYAGILPVQPDGGIHSVTWAVGDGPPVTRVGVNTETETYLPQFAERRTNERALDWLTNDWVRKNADLGPPLE